MPNFADLLNYSLPAASSIAGGLLNANAAGAASGTLANGATTAMGTINSGNQQIQDLLKQIYGQQTEALKPYQAAANPALTQLEAGTAPGGELVKPYAGFNAGDLENDPGYQFRLAQGNKALQRLQSSTIPLNSGGALKGTLRFNSDLASQEFGTAAARDESTFRANQATELDALLKQIGIGQTATGQAVTAAGNYGQQAVTQQTLTNEQIAQLQTEQASAQAAGQVEKANAIGSILSGVTSGIQNVEDLNAIKKLISPAGLAKAATVAAPVAGLATTGGTAATAGTALTGGAAAVPAISGAGGLAAAGAVPAAAAVPAASTAAGSAALAPAIGALPGAPLTGYAGGGLITSHGALIGMLSNPITIAVAGAILGTTALLKSQAHWEANTLGKEVQGPFNQNLSKMVDGFDRALAAGQLQPEQAQQIRDATAQAITQYSQALDEFSKKGKDNKKVADQARADMVKYYGPNWEKILGKMDGEIAQLQSAAPNPNANTLASAGTLQKAVA